MSSKQVSVFELSDIFKVPSNSTVKPKFKSRGKYQSIFENNFLLLPDGKTFIGGKSDSLKSEDITGKQGPMRIDKGNKIFTMGFNPKINSVLVGFANKWVSQYGRDSSGVMKMLRNYKDVGVGDVFASDIAGDIAVVGGQHGKITFINMQTRTLLQKGIQTAIKQIWSLKFCRISETEMHLIVGGRGKDYSDSKTDLFDVSSLFQSTSKQIPLSPFDHNPDLHSQSMSQIIQDLKSQLKAHKKTIDNAMANIETLQHKNLKLQKENNQLSRQLRFMETKLSMKGSIKIVKHAESIIKHLSFPDSGKKGFISTRKSRASIINDFDFTSKKYINHRVTDAFPQNCFEKMSGDLTVGMLLFNYLDSLFNATGI